MNVWMKISKMRKPADADLGDWFILFSDSLRSCVQGGGRGERKGGRGRGSLIHPSSLETIPKINNIPFVNRSCFSFLIILFTSNRRKARHDFIHSYPEERGREREFTMQSMIRNRRKGENKRIEKQIYIYRRRQTEERAMKEDNNNKKKIMVE